MNTEVSNVIYSSNYYEAQEQMVKQLHELGYSIVGSVDLGVDRYAYSCVGHIVLSWRYTANVKLNTEVNNL